MGCTYSAPLDEPTLRRSVPDSVRSNKLCRCPSGWGTPDTYTRVWMELLPGQEHPAGTKRVLCRVNQQSCGHLRWGGGSLAGQGHCWPFQSWICRLHVPVSKGRDLIWKPGRPQSPTPLPVKDQIQCANSSVKLSGDKAS